MNISTFCMKVLCLIGVVSLVVVPILGQDIDLSKGLSKIEGIPKENNLKKKSTHLLTSKNTTIFASKSGIKSTEKDTRDFIGKNRKVFQLRDGVDQLELKNKRTDFLTQENLTYEQTYNGVPVFGGTLKFHYDKTGNLHAVNGVVITDIKINPIPVLDQKEAENIALYLAKNTLDEQPKLELKVMSSRLLIYQKGLVYGVARDKYLTYEVEIKGAVGVKDNYYIDAHTGEFIDKIALIHTIDRKVYDQKLITSNLKWQEGQSLDALTVWQKSMVESSAHIYNLMKYTFGMNSYDNAEGVMNMVSNNPTGVCSNAFWDGVSVSFCNGMASDDIVAHEWAHAYTENTSGLVYAWQSGAMNESYSDIWGEVVDILNGYMDEGESTALRTGSNSSSRWIVGEKATAVTGGLRDMWDPNSKGHPTRVQDPLYHCNPTDEGGVHINSSIHNRAFSLLVDGGSLNGYLVSGIGLTKAAHIFWRSQMFYLTPISDFSDQADYLELSLLDLIGVPLPALTINSMSSTSTEVITEADLAELRKVIAAVEFKENVPCFQFAMFDATPPLCDGALPKNALFYQDFENGLGSFTTSVQTTSATFTPREWSLQNGVGRGGKVMFAPNSNTGNCITKDESGQLILTSPSISIPTTVTGQIVLGFEHYVSIENRWDGGLLMYKVGNSNWMYIPQNAFLLNGYTNKTYSTVIKNTNPLAGQSSFTGSNYGSMDGMWGQTRIDISSLGVVSGNTVQFRWILGSNCDGGYDGWYVDDIRLYTCSMAPEIGFVKNELVVDEREATQDDDTCEAYIDVRIPVRIDKALNGISKVRLTHLQGESVNGVDYCIVNDEVVLENGTVTGEFVIRVFDDGLKEILESNLFGLSLVENSTGEAYISHSNNVFTLKIVDDEQEVGVYSREIAAIDFNHQLLEKWRVINSGDYNGTWAVTSFPVITLDKEGKPFIANMNTLNLPYTFDEIFESPVLDVLGEVGVQITFDQEWNPSILGNNELGRVDVFDGSNWHTLLTQNKATGQKGNILLQIADKVTLQVPPQYVKRGFKVRFRHSGVQVGRWSLDNIRIRSESKVGVLSQVNSNHPAQEYLGPYQTVYFRDPSTRDLIAKVENLSEHDYGCTSVEVDRWGIGIVGSGPNPELTNKTFRIIPTLNNTSGRFKLTLYYTQEELGSQFNAASFQSIGKATSSLQSQEQLTYSNIEVSELSDGKYAFSAMFSAGFSGFGLSTLSSNNSLPVTWAYFNGTLQERHGLLSWSTTEEVNNDYFGVERLSETKHFVEIGRVQAKKPSGGNYEFFDHKLLRGINYYRLKQVDQDGSYVYSDIIAIENIIGEGFGVYPNPVVATLRFNLSGLTTTVLVSIIDLKGNRILSKQEVNASDGVDVSRLPTGIYWVILETSTGSMRRKFVKE